jgi:zona occludens toxin (predicted ATPase)
MECKILFLCSMFVGLMALSRVNSDEAVTAASSTAAPSTAAPVVEEAAAEPTTTAAPEPTAAAGSDAAEPIHSKFIMVLAATAITLFLGEKL